jgi:Vps5 C terminal like
MGTKLSIAVNKDDAGGSSREKSNALLSFPSSILASPPMKQLIKSVGDLFTSPCYSVDENDGWFEQAVAKLDEMDALFTRLHSGIQELLNQRRHLSSRGRWWFHPHQSDGMIFSVVWSGGCFQSPISTRV